MLIYLAQSQNSLSSKSRDLLSHVISECMQMRGRICENGKLRVEFGLETRPGLGQNLD